VSCTSARGLAGYRSDTYEAPLHNLESSTTPEEYKRRIPSAAKAATLEQLSGGFRYSVSTLQPPAEPALTPAGGAAAAAGGGGGAGALRAAAAVAGHRVGHRRAARAVFDARSRCACGRAAGRRPGNLSQTMMWTAVTCIDKQHDQASAGKAARDAVAAALLGAGQVRSSVIVYRFGKEEPRHDELRICFKEFG